jgi:hypothetical protein
VGEGAVRTNVGDQSPFRLSLFVIVTEVSDADEVESISDRFA